MNAANTTAATPLRRTAGPSALQATQRRWQILTEQLGSGHEPCFQTERRHGCGETDCAYRQECLSLRAEWLR